MDRGPVLRADRADVRRPRPDARPVLRRPSRSDQGLFAQYRRQPRRHRRLLRAFLPTVPSRGLAPDWRGSMYSLIHLLQKRSGGAPFDDVMVIGAGSGNDLSHALRYGVKRIDAVEIDPVIQDIGIHHHPNQPYSDPRVVPHLDDGRHFLRTTEQKYDLVVYALVDSLILHSGYANIRLESYLFTEQAFEDVRRVLKPGGVFVMYNYYRQGWIV